ncbi:MAG: DUF2161 family putative PD-(D/E)XK-type phosphodiesterase [Acidobacteriota bacterium]
MAETDLYLPVKHFLEAQGYTVKGEIGPCDITAIRDDDPSLVLVELKERLTLALVLQAVDRFAMSDTVYIAFRVGKGQSATWRTRRRQVLALARRLGLGVLTVSTRDGVTAVLDPTPYRPRINKRRRRRLLKEFAERVGDPEAGGSATGVRLTAYRQAAIRCARVLAEAGVLKASVIRDRAGVPRAGAMLRANHYGWFERVERGHYTLSPRGERELAEWNDLLEASGVSIESPEESDG